MRANSAVSANHLCSLHQLPTTLVQPHHTEPHVSLAGSNLTTQPSGNKPWVGDETPLLPGSGHVQTSCEHNVPPNQPTSRFHKSKQCCVTHHSCSVHQLPTALIQPHHTAHDAALQHVCEGGDGGEGRTTCPLIHNLQCQRHMHINQTCMCGMCVTSGERVINRDTRSTCPLEIQGNMTGGGISACTLCPDAPGARGVCGRGGSHVASSMLVLGCGFCAMNRRWRPGLPVQCLLLVRFTSPILHPRRGAAPHPTNLHASRVQYFSAVVVLRCYGQAMFTLQLHQPCILPLLVPFLQGGPPVSPGNSASPSKTLCTTPTDPTESHDLPFPPLFQRVGPTTLLSNHLHEPWVQHLSAVVLRCYRQAVLSLQLRQLNSQGLQGAPALTQTRGQLRLNI
jgi:hypothetical protein